MRAGDEPGVPGHGDDDFGVYVSGIFQGGICSHLSRAMCW